MTHGRRRWPERSAWKPSRPTSPRPIITTAGPTRGARSTSFFNYSWATAHLRNRRSATRDPVDPVFLDNLERVDNLDRFISLSPLDHDKTLLDLGPWYQEWIDHPALDAYWDHLNIAGEVRSARYRELRSGGWYDVFLGGTIANYVGMKGDGGGERAKQGSRLLIGPWSHATASLGGAAGDYFPERSSAGRRRYARSVDSLFRSLASGS
ncbi:MAG: CocE/NonD family hydrolase [Thermomicrobiales bacterium]